MTISTTSILPELPLTCLNTAELKSTSSAFKGKHTVIGKYTFKKKLATDWFAKLYF